MHSSSRNFRCCLFTIFLLLGFAFRVTAAHASLKITTGNPGLEHFDTDGGVQLDFGLTDENGNPVGNLRPDNVKVFEDGKEAKIIDFRGVGQGRPVDIVFVLDVTESMQPYIDAVKANVIEFAQDLQSNSRDYRLGLVTFEDYVVSSYPDCNCAYRDSFTSDVKQFTDWVGTLTAGGGGDIPEDQLDALAYAAKFPFRPEAEGIIIIVTDAPPHHDGDGSADSAHDQAFWDHHTRGVQVTDQTGTKVADLLKKNGILAIQVITSPDSRYESLRKGVCHAATDANQIPQGAQGPYPRPCHQCGQTCVRPIRPQGDGAGADHRAADRSRAPRSDPEHEAVRAGLDPCVPGCAGVEEAARSSHGLGQGRAGTVGSARQTRPHPVRDRRGAGGCRQAIAGACRRQAAGQDALRRAHQRVGV